MRGREALLIYNFLSPARKVRLVTTARRQIACRVFVEVQADSLAERVIIIGYGAGG